MSADSKRITVETGWPRVTSLDSDSANTRPIPVVENPLRLLYLPCVSPRERICEVEYSVVIS